ncbi:uncharacterized protein [Diadema antillarum]|uniref:uncharacterized protein n=1 Tax=Diadema antillarum TaxID=105358 RepID=UPI003A85A6F6
MRHIATSRATLSSAHRRNSVGWRPKHSESGGPRISPNIEDSYADVYGFSIDDCSRIMDRKRKYRTIDQFFTKKKLYDDSAVESLESRETNSPSDRPSAAETPVSQCGAGASTSCEDCLAGSSSSEPRQTVEPETDVDIIGEVFSKGKQNLTDSDILRALQGRSMPKKSDLPFSVHNKCGKVEKRFLGIKHFDEYPWLTYSKAEGTTGAWCLWCVLFKLESSCGGHWDAGVQKVGTLVSKPLQTYAKLTGKDGVLSKHANTNYHKFSASKVTELLVRAPAQSQRDVRNILDKGRRETVAANTAIMRSIVDTILTCARQNIALRGHRDSGRLEQEEPEENDGNFRALLRMRIRAGDQTLQKHFVDGPGNAKYISPDIQNNLLDCASAIVRERILDKVRKAGVWSVLADETMDRKKREQLTIAVRYVEEDDMGRMTIQESPICIVDVLDEMIEKEKIDPSVGDELTMSGKNIASVILAKLKDFNLDLEKLVGQGYDGASSMASQQVGVAAKVREQAPHAEYFHCAMHMLNLCATKTTEVVPVRNCLDTIQQITAFFNSSAKRVKHLEAEIDKAGIDHHQRKRLKTLCQTRFLERHEAVINLLSLLPHVISTLDQMSAWQTSDARPQAERTFSKVERTASAVRASMGEERLEALVLLQTHRSETPSPDDVIARFATLKSRRIVL